MVEETKTKQELLGDKTPSVDLESVIRAMRLDPFAYYDEKKKVRKVPIFTYEGDTPVEIIRWQTRPVADDLKTAQKKAWDFYHPERGWIREGKKAEKDYDYKPDKILEEK